MNDIPDTLPCPYCQDTDYMPEDDCGYCGGIGEVVNWYAAYHEAIGALMCYTPKLAKKIDDKYKVQS